MVTFSPICEEGSSIQDRAYDSCNGQKDVRKVHEQVAKGDRGFE